MPQHKSSLNAHLTVSVYHDYYAIIIVVVVVAIIMAK